MERPQIFFRVWDAAYFDPALRKWHHGQLKLSAKMVLFSYNVKNSNDDLTISLDTMKAVRLATSSMIFPCITIDSNDDSHWFSSLKDRNSTFNVIDHFFKAALLSNNTGLFSSNSPSSSKHTRLGKDLLHSVYDSDETLRVAAANLTQQGDQLKGMRTTMTDIQSDLSIAERITKGLDSWLGRWRMPEACRVDEIILVNDRDVPDVLDVEILYTSVLASKVSPQTPGVCRVTSAGISVLSMKQQVIGDLSWSQVSRIRAVSPWELEVTQYRIGQPDLSYNLVSVYASRILKMVTKFAGAKVEYLDPSTDDTGQDDRDQKNFSEHSSTFHSSLNYSPNQSDHNVFGGAAGQDTIQQEPIVSVSELGEIGSVLCSMKEMALNVCKEQDDQVKVIDDVTNNVTIANDRIRKINKKMDRLLKN